MSKHRLYYDGRFTVIGETIKTQYYPIRPDQISDGHFGGFGKAEVEWAAEKLIAFFKSRGYWTGFTLNELHRFYKGKGWETDNVFLGIMGAWFDDGMAFMRWREPADVFIAVTERGVHFVTNNFIDRCANAVREERKSGVDTPSEIGGFGGEILTEESNREVRNARSLITSLVNKQEREGLGN